MMAKLSAVKIKEKYSRITRELNSARMLAFSPVNNQDI